MRRVRISELRPGMRTAEDVFSYNNQMIVPKGASLDDKIITRLEFYSVLAVRIMDEEDERADAALSAGPFEGEINENSSYSQKTS